jgi:hypothetical protein
VVGRARCQTPTQKMKFRGQGKGSVLTGKGKEWPDGGRSLWSLSWMGAHCVPHSWTWKYLYQLLHLLFKLPSPNASAVPYAAMRQRSDRA